MDAENSVNFVYNFIISIECNVTKQKFYASINQFVRHESMEFFSFFENNLYICLLIAYNTHTHFITQRGNSKTKMTSNCELKYLFNGQIVMQCDSDLINGQRNYQ